MSTRTLVPPQSYSRQPSILERALTAIFSGIGLFVLAVVVFLVGFQVLHFGKIYPGITIAGVDLGGMPRPQVENILAQQFPYHTQGKITITFDDQVWEFTPREIGFLFDPASTTEAAYKIGRRGWPWQRISERYQAWKYGLDLAPQYIYDARLAQLQIDQIAQEVNRPTVEASLEINGLDVVVQPGQVGRTVDSYTTAGLLALNLLNLQDAVVPLQFVEQPPAILDVSAQAEIARNILSEPLVLKVPGATADDPGPWTMEPETLADIMIIERINTEQGKTYQIGLDHTELRIFLETIAPGVYVAQPENPRFMFNDETSQLEVIKKAVVARELNIEASIEHINQQLAEGDHKINLVFNITEPEVLDTTTGAELGITELVSAQDTYFFGSGASRKNNIEVAAAQFHGLLVPPGATFSMVEHIGDISLDSGYAEAWIIYGDRTIKGVGGGVCQVSTTLFRTVFFGGYPIVERHPHSYRVYYYEQNTWGGVDETLAGLDATVYAPIVDFKFKNDTPYWLLMETYVYANQITWKFYSTSDGRTVEWDTTGPTDRVSPPEPIYEVNEELAKGEIKQVDWEAEGANVSVDRIVYRNGEVLFNETIDTHYSAWADIYQCGPKTEGCPPEEKKNKKDDE
ncbi:MAG: VanW family protein [Anaerolineales bacterium]|nr:VanW family protein [Anaerolineales bacterium]